MTSESTLHQLSPYIGKLKSSIAASLITRFSRRGDWVYDPFSGSGTVAFEAWIKGRNVIANDLSPYAVLLTRAKLFPYASLKDTLADLNTLNEKANEALQQVDLRTVPAWVRRFFHTETLREVIAWSRVLRNQRRWLILAALFGILHHQRPGFLSFPSSHTVPYLRLKSFPPAQFPELYEYRSVRDRLEAKLVRSYRRVPVLDFRLERECFSKSAHLLRPNRKVDAIITSPPYMRQLDYARDNRLRLWFLGMDDAKALDRRISPRKDAFLHLMARSLRVWKSIVKPGGYCVLVIGDGHNQLQHANLPTLVSRIATRDVGGYKYVTHCTEPIPNERRVRRGLTGSLSETIVVLQNNTIGRVKKA